MHQPQRHRQILILQERQDRFHIQLGGDSQVCSAWPAALGSEGAFHGDVLLLGGDVEGAECLLGVAVRVQELKLENHGPALSILDDAIPDLFVWDPFTVPTEHPILIWADHDDVTVGRFRAEEWNIAKTDVACTGSARGWTAVLRPR